MNPVVIRSFEEFETYKGKELGISDYLKITQDQINTMKSLATDGVTQTAVHIVTEAGTKKSSVKILKKTKHKKQLGQYLNG